MSTSSKLKTWLQRALWFVPVAYSLNFLYAVLSNQSGGTFGDTFGAANALFSGVALMMLIYAVILQREELELVKEERNDTRKLLEGQEKINELQERAYLKQSFEQSFFSLVRVISEERRALDLPPNRNAGVSIVTIAAINVKSNLKKNKSTLGWELSNMATECGTTARLLITAYGFLNEQGFEPVDALKYVSTLHALLDSDFAHVFLVLVARWQDGDPRALQTANDLQLVDFIDENLRQLAEMVISGQIV